MKALAKTKKEVGLWMIDAPKPECGANDLLIKIKKTAICGTDIHIYKWDEWSQKNIPVPMITGHEFVGIIHEVGSHVSGYQVGDRVSGEGHLTCAYCRNCRAGRRHLCRNTVSIGVNRQGAFAEFLSIPATNAFPIPDDISDDTASILDPLGNSVHTALTFDSIGEDTLITGAGPIGIMAVAICRHIGARHIVITDINEHRLELARKIDPKVRTVNTNNENLKDILNELNMTEGFDVGLEMSGNAQALQDMLDTMNNGGRIASLGIFPENMVIDWNQIVFKGLTLKGIYGREMFETWYKMKTMLQSGLNISPVITHHFSIDDYQQGFETMLSGKSGKVILNWE